MFNNKNVVLFFFDIKDDIPLLYIITIIRRFISSAPIKLNCFDCRLYNKNTKLCKINKLNASENRIDPNICGIDGKHFWALYKTDLIKSETNKLYSDGFNLVAFVGLPYAIFYDFRIVYLSCSSFIIARVFLNISKTCKEKYLDDNGIDDN